MSKIEFPNEPIRYPTPRPVTPEERAEQDEVFAEWDDLDREPSCWWCAGEGYLICDGGIDCPEADDAGCPFVDFHTYSCGSCGGTGHLT